MQSLLIISEDKQKREQYARDYCVKQGIADADTTIVARPFVEKKETKKTAQSIGIDQIKRIQETLFLKPVKSPMKAVIIQDAQLLTTEAQNAMLKILEEPPAQTVIILTSESREALLSTILSRCTIIELGVQKVLTEQERVDYGQFLQLILSISVPDGLKLAESLSKNKDDAIIWLEKMILLSRTHMLENQQYVHIVQPLHKTHTLLKTTNVNTRFALERLFLSFCH